MAEVSFQDREAVRKFLRQVGEGVASMPHMPDSLTIRVAGESEGFRSALTEAVTALSCLDPAARGPELPIGQRIAEMRARLGNWPPRKLAFLLDVPESSIYRWESGKSEPSHRHFEALREIAAKHGCESTLLGTAEIAVSSVREAGEGACRIQFSASALALLAADNLKSLP